MKKILTLLVALGLTFGAVDVSMAKSENSAEGKSIGSNDKGDKGRSADAPGQTGATGKDNAPGKNK